MMLAIFQDGSRIELTAEQGQRALYALTSLAVTPLAHHLNIQRIEGGDGQILWQSPKGSSGS
ncbi:hypothetical protein [Paracoccus sp. TOH]|uniref:hypothetical protein n=1 Tax=Paracoccus sp. TOH TaxID=1263728 RepID=UPI0025B118E4|nr:hypothetical protein [Paracoccus sp. TOH]WJS87270.1 hypothetical protein NBE95_20540 [Paracoccus sp. TOH]